ncbi:MAG: hypothetical protein ABEJ70_09095 [Halobacteriaceae archaeon]
MTRERSWRSAADTSDGGTDLLLVPARSTAGVTVVSSQDLYEQFER